MFNTAPAADGFRRELNLSLRDKINQLEDHVRKLLLKSKQALALTRCRPVRVAEARGGRGKGKGNNARVGRQSVKNAQGAVFLRSQVPAYSKNDKRVTLRAAPKPLYHTSRGALARPRAARDRSRGATPCGGGGLVVAGARSLTVPQGTELAGSIVQRTSRQGGDPTCRLA